LKSVGRSRVEGVEREKYDGDFVIIKEKNNSSSKKKQKKSAENLLSCGINNALRLRNDA
jgi:calcineurin-like phosphoesterase